MDRSVKTWDEGPSADYQLDLNPYDSFMRKHLEHYGYYTGRNQGFRSNFSSYAEWEKTYGYNLSSDSGSESDNDDSDESKKNGDNKLQEELLRTTQLVYSYQDGKGMVPKLREPRSLFALSKELGPQQAARWPSEIQVLNETIKHLYYIPPEPEPFYKPTGLEKTPMVRGEENGGRLVYMYEPKSCFFMRSRVNGCRTGPEKVTCNLKSPEDKTLLFDSRFESGNLARAVQTNETDYECWLRYDLYTTRNTQWFYFRVSNTRPNVTYRFTIVNFMKPDSLYNYGMRPLMYSQKNADTKKIGWIRCGSEIKYYKNNLKYQSGRGEKPFYSLTWTVQFQHSHDTVYFAHCFPYTYTDLQDYLLDLSNDPIKSKICKQRVLCRTLAGNLVYVLTITSPSQSPEDIKHKKAVVITARVHPGECNSSWMMKGFLDYLTGNSADAKLLRDTFIFKIVPMLNPDGVIVGNYRCSLAGRDLNRNYKTVLKDSYPSVWHTKNMIRRLLQEREIIVYCDLHGHSRKQNVFIYGCENRYSPDKRLKERVFPCMLNKNAPEKFNFASCKFKVQKSKEGTGRIVMWNMGIMNSYTMEATFCGSTIGKMKGYHFSMSDYESLGFHFCDTLLDYCDPDKTKMNNVMLELEEKMRKEILTRLQRQGVSVDNPSEIDLSDEYDSSLESSDGGSDSSVSDGPPVHLQFAAREPAQPYNKKKKKLKSKKDRDKLRSAKDDVKVKDRPSSDQCEKKNPHLTSHAKTDKTQSMRYMSNSANKNRPKSYEGMNGTDRTEDKKDRRNEYLELLTKEYSRNGLNSMQPSETPTQPHFRYSGSGKLSNAMPFQWEGLCPHHEQKVAASIMAAQLTDSVQSGDIEQQLSELCHTDDDGNIEDYVRSQLNQSATSVSPPSSRTPIQRHIVEVSASQQRQQDLLQHRHCENKSGNAIRQHPCPFDECTNRVSPDEAKSGRQRAAVPSATFVHYDTQPTKPHLVDKAKSESRLELLERESSQPERIKSNDKQDKNESCNEQNGNINNDDNPKEVEKTKGKERVSSGRRSRMGIRSREEYNPMSASQPNYLVNPHIKGQSRVQSAKGQKEVDNAIESIKELRQSLVSNATQQNLSPTTGGYIKRLMQETGRDIQNLTNEIKHDIEMKKKMAEDHTEEAPTDEVTIDQVRHIPDSAPPEQFNPSQSIHPYPVFDKNNFVQLDELSGNEALMGKGYPEQWKNLSTQDNSTMTDAPKRSHGRGKKNIASNYPMSDRTYERNGKGEVISQSNTNNSNNRRIPDGSVVDSYQISTLDRTNYRENINNNSAGSKQSGSTYDLRPVTDRNFQEQYIKKSKKAELKETNISAPANNRTSSSGTTAPSVSDRYFEQPNRVRSAKGSSQSKQLAQPSSAAEAMPTKIQLMISQDHQEEKCFGGQFLPLSRTIRAPFYRTGTKKK